MKDLNSVSLTGRLTRDPDSYKTQDGKSIARFSLAVNGYNDSVDFINCTAFGNVADIIFQYLSKGRRVLVTGSIKTGSYQNKQGQRINTTAVTVRDVVFIDSKKDDQQGYTNQTTAQRYDTQNYATQNYNQSSTGGYTTNDFYAQEKNIMESYKSDNYAVDDQDIQF